MKPTVTVLTAVRVTPIPIVHETVFSWMVQNAPALVHEPGTPSVEDVVTTSYSLCAVSVQEFVALQPFASVETALIEIVPGVVLSSVPNVKMVDPLQGLRV